MSIDKTKLAELAKYFDKRERQLFDCFGRLEDHLSDDIQAIINPSDGSKYDGTNSITQQNISRIKRAANTFRYSMLVAVCAFHEEVMVSIGRLAVTGYENKLNRQKKGNFIATHTSLLESECGIRFGEVNSQIETMDDLWTVRNCIVHAWGNAGNVFDKPKLQDAVARLNAVGVSCIQFTRDDELYFPVHDIVSIALTTGEDVVHHLIKELS